MRRFCPSACTVKRGRIGRRVSSADCSTVIFTGARLAGSPLCSSTTASHINGTGITECVLFSASRKWIEPSDCTTGVKPLIRKGIRHTGSLDGRCFTTKSYSKPDRRECSSRAWARAARGPTRAASSPSDKTRHAVGFEATEPNSPGWSRNTARPAIATVSNHHGDVDGYPTRVMATLPLPQPDRHLTERTRSTRSNSQRSSGGFR